MSKPENAKGRSASASSAIELAELAAFSARVGASMNRLATRVTLDTMGDDARTGSWRRPLRDGLREGFKGVARGDARVPGLAPQVR